MNCYCETSDYKLLQNSEQRKELGQNIKQLSSWSDSFPTNDIQRWSINITTQDHKQKGLQQIQDNIKKQPGLSSDLNDILKFNTSHFLFNNLHESFVNKTFT